MNPVGADTKEGGKLSSGVLSLRDFSRSAIGFIELNDLVEVIMLNFNVTFDL